MEIRVNTRLLCPVEARLVGVVVGVETVVEVAVTRGLNSDVEPKPEVVVLSMAVVVAEMCLEARLRLEGRVRVACWLVPLETVV